MVPNEVYSLKRNLLQKVVSVKKTVKLVDRNVFI